VVRTSAPAHDRQALLLKGILAVLGGSGSVFTLSGLGDWAAPMVAHGDQDRLTIAKHEHLGHSPGVAVQQSDAADEGRMEAGCSMVRGLHLVVRLSS